MALCCGECGCELWPWEEIYSWETRGGTEYVCEDCFDALFASLSRRERAELTGSEVLRAEDAGGEG